MAKLRDPFLAPYGAASLWVSHKEEDLVRLVKVWLTAWRQESGCFCGLEGEIQRRDDPYCLKVMRFTGNRLGNG